jgi:hypothetical protein
VFSHISLSIFSIVYTFLVLFDSMFVIVKLMLAATICRGLDTHSSLVN